MNIELSGPLGFARVVNKKGTNQPSHVNVGMHVNYSIRQSDGSYEVREQTKVQFAVPVDHPFGQVLTSVEPGAIISVTAGDLFIKEYEDSAKEWQLAIELKRVRQVALVAVRTFDEKVRPNRQAETKSTPKSTRRRRPAPTNPLDDMVDGEIPV